jgi:hypothetical protein
LAKASSGTVAPPAVGTCRLWSVSTQVPTAGGATVPLLAFAKIHYDLEQPIVWRRDRMTAAPAPAPGRPRRRGRSRRGPG